jgi:hypothetical protein
MQQRPEEPIADELPQTENEHNQDIDSSLYQFNAKLHRKVLPK